MVTHMQEVTIQLLSDTQRRKCSQINESLKVSCVMFLCEKIRKGDFCHG